MTHSLPELPYKTNALEPYISKNTIEFHYGKHHQAYVTNTNKLIQGTKFEEAKLEDIIKHSDGALFNNSAQVWNHSFYFHQFSPKPNKKPIGAIATAIDKRYNTFENFKEEFSKTAVSLFGSGWVWLVKNHTNDLQIIAESNAGNPMLLSLHPLMVIDVWEHAYYLDYQNKRADYIANFWHILDWNIISQRFDET